MIIRQARVSDATNLLEYVKTVFDETIFLSRDSKSFNVTKEMEENLINSMNANDRAIMLIAVDEQKIVGCITVKARALPRQSHVASFGISVLKSHYGLGIGTMFIEKAIEFCRQKSILKLSLDVDSTNERAIRLYKKFGFIEEGRKVKEIFVNQEYHDLIQMYLWLE